MPDGWRPTLAVIGILIAIFGASLTALALLPESKQITGLFVALSAASPLFAVLAIARKARHSVSVRLERNGANDDQIDA